MRENPQDTRNGCKKSHIILSIFMQTGPGLKSMRMIGRFRPHIPSPPIVWITFSPHSTFGDQKKIIAKPFHTPSIPCYICETRCSWWQLQNIGVKYKIIITIGQISENMVPIMLLLCSHITRLSPSFTCFFVCFAVCFVCLFVCLHLMINVWAAIITIIIPTCTCWPYCDVAAAMICVRRASRGLFGGY